MDTKLVIALIRTALEDASNSDNGYEKVEKLRKELVFAIMEIEAVSYKLYSEKVNGK